jgi:hypothetical protein
MTGTLIGKTIALCTIIAGLFLFAGCAAKVRAPRIPAMKYGEKAPFGPETIAAPMREIPEEIAPPQVIK